MKIFLDTSALVALYNGDDAHHEEAQTTMDMIRRREIPLSETYPFRTSQYRRATLQRLCRHKKTGYCKEIRGDCEAWNCPKPLKYEVKPIYTQLLNLPHA